MRVCFIVNEFFAWGKYGGFGSSTRNIATELAKRGLEVCVATPRRKGQKPVEYMDGVTVRGFSPFSIREHIMTYRTCDANIYHSQEPSLGTLLAMKAAPDRKHIVTCHDTRTFRDWVIEVKSYVSEKRFKSLLTLPYEENPFVSRAVRKADAVFSEAKHLVPKAQKKYRLTRPPRFMPQPVRMPISECQKSDQPIVCFVGRWDKRKRPELFFELAKQFPYVKFIAMGEAQNNRRDASLRRTYGSIPNLEMTGFLDQFCSTRFHDVLSQSWILINTSSREGLPISFLEAASFRCAILSSVDTDDFASQFGYWARKGDFATGLRFLLNNDEWKQCGDRAYEYVKATHELGVVVDRHLQAYSEL